jgi:hypothetical protein
MVLIRILDASVWSVGSAKDVPFGRLFAASGSEKVYHENRRRDVCF